MINTKRLIDNFLKLIKINSESGNEKEITSYLKKFLTKNLEAKVIIDKYGKRNTKHYEKLDNRLNKKHILSKLLLC